MSKVNNSDTKLTYISLFSSAGVGCYGFKQNGFDCIATNELLPVRIDVQRANKKCKYDTGYICGDITKQEVQASLFAEIDKWYREEQLDQVDVVFATPPCQGMSTVNYKKNDHEQIRNSLVVQAIKIICRVHPKVFVFENVRAFLKSICTDLGGENMLIEQSILKNLSEEYNIYYKVVNFKDYGVPSSRPRTIVIGTSKNLDNVSPLNLFPSRQKEITLREAIGAFTPLEFGTKDRFDPLHFARPFPEHQLEWIADLVEGQSAFEKPVEKQPYKIDENGNKIILKGAYMGNKYRRLFWDKPCACIATRNDVLSSQDTIHPRDNRVLSIRELMRLMTIPDSFQWTAKDVNLTVNNSDEYLRKNEMNIRHCIGEAVPTQIMLDISAKIKQLLIFHGGVIKHEPKTANYYERISQIATCELPKQTVIFSRVMSRDTEKTKIRIKVLSPEVLLVYLPQILGYFSHLDGIEIDALGFNPTQIEQASGAIKLLKLGQQVKINYIDTERYNVKYDFELTTPDFGIEEPLKQLTLFES